MIIKLFLEITTHYILTLEANISCLKTPYGKRKTSFENYMFSAFNSIPASLTKIGFKKIS